MELEKLKKNTIVKLKKIKEEQDLSCAKIMDLLEERGQYVSESTIKKIFADGSEERSFRYQDSIAPLADVLLDMYGDQSHIDDVESLREIIREKNKQIEFLTIKIEEQKDVYSERKKMFEQRIDDLNVQISRLESMLLKREDCVARKDALLEKLLNAYFLKEENTDILSNNFSKNT